MSIEDFIRGSMEDFLRYGGDDVVIDGVMYRGFLGPIDDAETLIAGGYNPNIEAVLTLPRDARATWAKGTLVKVPREGASYRIVRVQYDGPSVNLYLESVDQ